MTGRWEARCQSQMAGATPGVWCALYPGHDAPHLDPTGQRHWRDAGEVLPRRGDYPANVAIAASAVVAASIVTGQPTEDILGRRRHYPIAAARHVAIGTIRAETALSLPEIALLLGGRDHTTILNSVRRAEADEALAAQVTEARRLIPSRGEPVEAR